MPITPLLTAMPATDDHALLPFLLPSIHRKKVTAAFDGGQIYSDGGVLLLAGVDKQLGLIDMLAAIIPDHRDPNLITHPMADILRPRVFAIACGDPEGYTRQHFLYFFPLPHGHGSLRPTLSRRGRS